MRSPSRGNEKRNDKMQVVISYHVFVTVAKTTEEAGTALPNVVDQGHAEPIAREQAMPVGRP